MQNQSQKNWIGLILLIVAISALIVLFVLSIPKIYGFVSAPRYSSLDYTHTSFTPGASFCLIVCFYHPNYNYKAQGYQKDIVKPIIQKLKEQGFSQKNPHVGDDASDIRCFGRAGDQYYFWKSTKKTYDYNGETRHEMESIKVAFYAATDLGNVKSQAIGCDRPISDYRVEVTVSDRQVIGF